MLLAYTVTQNLSYMERLKNSILSQVKINQASTSTKECIPVLFTDVKPDKLSTEIKEYFQNNIHTVNPFVYDENRGVRYFCRARLLNASLAYAKEVDAKWLMTCDADTIVANINPDKMPITGFGAAKVYLQKAPEESIEDSLSIIAVNKTDVFSTNNSWFVLNSRVYRDMMFDERYLGYGFEDTDFRFRTVASGFDSSNCEVHVVHGFHTEEMKGIDKYRWKVNSKIFNIVRKMKHLGADMRHPQKYQLIQAEHAEWEKVASSRSRHWAYSNIRRWSDGELQHLWKKALSRLGQIWPRDFRNSEYNKSYVDSEYVRKIVLVLALKIDRAKDNNVGQYPEVDKYDQSCRRS